MSILRSRIDGAKTRCLAIPDTHVRQSDVKSFSKLVHLNQSKISKEHMGYSNQTGLYPLPSFSGRNNAYDGVQEFWITIREKGERTTETTYAEIHTKTAKVPSFHRGPPITCHASDAGRGGPRVHNGRCEVWGVGQHEPARSEGESP